VTEVGCLHTQHREAPATLYAGLDLSRQRAALRGLVYRACGTGMRGEAHIQRGTEVRCYRCPSLACHARRCPADSLEKEVLGTISGPCYPPRPLTAPAPSCAAEWRPLGSQQPVELGPDSLPAWSSSRSGTSGATSPTPTTWPSGTRLAPWRNSQIATGSRPSTPTGQDCWSCPTRSPQRHRPGRSSRK